MKKTIISIFLAFLAVISMNSLTIKNVKSQAFYQLQANCSFNQAQGKCEAFNTMPFPVACDLSIFGRTKAGFKFQEHETALVMPGQNIYGFVYAQNPYADPLVGTWGSVNCKG